MGILIKVLITGSRKWSNKRTISDAINFYTNNTDNPICIIQGECPYGGADKLAKDYALEQCIPVISVPADWNKYGNRAGPIRNKFMVDYFRPNIVLAFPLGDSRGTIHCMKYAAQNNILVYNYGTPFIMEGVTNMGDEAIFNDPIFPN